MIKLVIFDCDGTLVDSEILCNQALEFKLNEMGVTISAQVLIGRFRGVKFQDILSTIEREHEITLPVSFELEYREKVREFFAHSLVANDGVSTLLQNIELPVCVASSAPISKITQALSVTELAPFFSDNIFSCFDIDSWKPEPDIFLYAAEKMGFKPENCLVVEDSPVGVEAAHAAGMDVVLYDPHNTYPDIVATHTVSSMSDLGSLLI